MGIDIESLGEMVDRVVNINRVAKVVKGGRRFSFSALVVVGNRQGSVGLGYGEAPGVPAAIEKAQKAAKKQIVKITLQEGTLPHAVIGSFKASAVKLIPASPGTGVIAGATARAVLDMAGVHDCLTKSMRSNSQQNLAKATMEGLMALTSKTQIAELRGVQIESSHVDSILEAGRRFAPTTTAKKKAEAPKAFEPSKGGRGKGRGKSKPRPAAATTSATAVAEPPAPAPAPAPEAPAPVDPPAAPPEEPKTEA